MKTEIAQKTPSKAPSETVQRGYMLEHATRCDMTREMNHGRFPC